MALIKEDEVPTWMGDEKSVVGLKGGKWRLEPRGKDA
jgi:hypothetical protein